MMRQILMTVFVCLAMAGSGNGAEPIPQPVRAELTDGRVLTGRVDTRTDNTFLRLTLTTGRIRLTAPVRWDEVQAVQIQNSSFTGREFQEQWEDFAVAPQPLLASRPVEQPRVPVRNRVAAINGDAWLGNWDRRPDADGLVLELVVFDTEGRPVVESGQLDVQLIGLRQGDRGGRGTFGKKPNILILERWGFPVRASDFHDGSLQLRLPFRQLRPQTAINVADDAFLRVRYGVPSQGVFDLSLPDVFIREFSPFRDELYQATGSRLLPTEQP